MDPRLKVPGGLADLAERISLALDDEESLRACTVRLGLPYAQSIRGNYLIDKCQSLILEADDKGKLTDLITDVIRSLGQHSQKGAHIQAWASNGVGLLELGDALRQCNKATSDLRLFTDPSRPILRL